MVNSEWTVKTLSICDKDSWLRIREKSVLMKNSQFEIDCWFKVKSGKSKWYSALSAKNSGFIVNFANQSRTYSQIAKQKWIQSELRMKIVKKKQNKSHYYSANKWV